MNPKTAALRVTTAALLSSYFLSPTAVAVEPEKQPTYSNITNSGLCGTDETGPAPPIPCTVPAGRRLIIDHVSGYAFLPTSADSTVAVSLVITDPRLGLNEAAFHSFVGIKTNTSGGTDVFTFNTPFKMMLHPGATFFFSPANSAAVSGYLVRE